MASVGKLDYDAPSARIRPSLDERMRRQVQGMVRPDDSDRAPLSSKAPFACSLSNVLKAFGRKRASGARGWKTR